MNTQIEIDTKQVSEALDRLNNKDFDKVVKKSLGKAKNLIVKTAKNNLRSHTSQAKSRYSNLIHRWYLIYKHGTAVGAHSLEQGIQAKWHKDDLSYKINIMKDFRLKFFENGTQDRYYNSKHGKRHYTGKNQAWHFFNQAVSSTKSQAQQIIDNNIAQNLQQIWNSQHSAD